MTEVYPDHEGYYWILFRCSLRGGKMQDYWLVGYWRSEEWWEIHTIDEHVFPNDSRLLELGPEITR